MKLLSSHRAAKEKARSKEAQKAAKVRESGHLGWWVGVSIATTRCIMNAWLVHTHHSHTHTLTPPHTHTHAHSVSYADTRISSYFSLNL